MARGGYCSNCSNARMTSKYCPDCGAEVISLPSCPKCGHTDHGCVPCEEGLPAAPFGCDNLIEECGCQGVIRPEYTEEST